MVPCLTSLPEGLALEEKYVQLELELCERLHRQQQASSPLEKYASVEEAGNFDMFSIIAFLSINSTA